MKRMPSTLMAVALAGAAFLIVSPLVASPLSAEAATLGPGYGIPGQPSYHLGGYADPDGTVSYCINAGAPSALGKVTTDVGIVGSVNGLAPAAMAQLNEVLSAHGNTSDDTTAAAVAMAVWSIAGPADYNAEGGDGYVLGRAPAAQRPAIQALANAFRAEAAAYSVPIGSATLTLSIDPTNDALGFLDVRSTAAGTVTLANGLFADNSLATHPIADGGRLALIGIPTGTDPYRVSATAHFTGAPSPSPDVHLYTTPGAQTLSASGTSMPTNFSATASDSVDRTVPGITTRAQNGGRVGETVIDTVTAVNVPSAGEQLSWAGYLQPIDATAPICTAATLVFSSSTPRTITADGDYDSEAFPIAPADVGRIFWIATAEIGGTVVAQDSCGNAGETSVLSPAHHLPVVSG
jgi:hypothetical protein